MTDDDYNDGRDADLIKVQGHAYDSETSVLGFYQMQHTNHRPAGWARDPAKGTRTAKPLGAHAARRALPAASLPERARAFPAIPMYADVMSRRGHAMNALATRATNRVQSATTSPLLGLRAPARCVANLRQPGDPPALPFGETAALAKNGRWPSALGEIGRPRTRAAE